MGTSKTRDAKARRRCEGRAEQGLHKHWSGDVRLGRWPWLENALEKRRGEARYDAGGLAAKRIA